MVSPFGSPCSSPRKSRKNKNPYSSRGLDKFSALLSELEEKRRNIYAKIDSEDAPLVRFVYTSSGECVPVIIKSSNIVKTPKKSVQDAKIKASVQEPKAANESKESFDGEMKREEPNPFKKIEERPCGLNVNLRRMRRPSHYLPVTVILVLVFLAFFGRSVAIMCTCIAWYLVPTISDDRGNKKLVVKKKSFTRKLSNESKGSFNPRTRNNVVQKEKSPCLSLPRGL